MNNWEVSKVMDSRVFMFFGMIGFWCHYQRGRDVSNVIYMIACFQLSNAFGQNIGNWDVSKVIDMEFYVSEYVFNSKYQQLESHPDVISMKA